METVELVLAMLLAVVVSGHAARILPSALPLPLVQIGLGFVISGVLHHGVELDPDIFFLLFLPPLLFLDGWRIPKDGLFRDKKMILQMALGLVVVTVLGAGWFIHWLIPTVPLPVAFALAAVVSPTDAVAVSSIAKRSPIPKRLMHVLEGESLLNDASGLVCFRFAVAAVTTGAFSLATASSTFLWVALAGLATGVAVTWVVFRAQSLLSRHFGETIGSAILVNLLIPFGAYLVAERVHASGILAAVSAGITMSYVELTGRALAATRVQRTAVWETVQFALNGVMFVLLGEQLPNILRSAATAVHESGRMNPWWLGAYAFALTAGLVLVRFLWVFGSMRLRLFREQRRGEAIAEVPSWRFLAAASLAGVRGAITLAGVLTLPLTLPDGAPFPARDLAIFLAAAVILLSLVLASVGLPRLLRDLPTAKDDRERKSVEAAKREAARAAVAAVHRARDALPRDSVDSELVDQASARVLALYEQRLGEDDASEGSAERLREADHERALRLAGLDAERSTIYELARQRTISDEAARELVRELDLLETHYR